MKNLEIIQSKIQNIVKVQSLRSCWRFQDKKVVFTNGCFDLIHLGHIEYLSKAADFGDVLIVGINTDASVENLKGKGRPIQNETARYNIIAALHFVDVVIPFHQETPLTLIQALQPDILVKGKDYDIKDIVGADFVVSNGGSVFNIELTPGYSTTTLIEKISENYKS